MAAAKKKSWSWSLPSFGTIVKAIVALLVIVTFSSQLRGRDNVLGSIPTILAYAAWMVGTLIEDTWNAFCFFCGNVADAWMACWGDVRPLGFILTIALIGLVVRIIQNGLSRWVKIVGILVMIPSAPFLFGLVGAAGIAIVYWVEHTRMVLEMVVAFFLIMAAILLAKGGAPIHAPKGGGGGGHGGH